MRLDAFGFERARFAPRFHRLVHLLLVLIQLGDLIVRVSGFAATIQAFEQDGNMREWDGVARLQFGKRFIFRERFFKMIGFLQRERETAARGNVVGKFGERALIFFDGGIPTLIPRRVGRLFQRILKDRFIR